MQLVGAVLDAMRVSEGLRVLELYAGSGNFTIPLAKLGARVTTVESDAGAAANARDAARAAQVARSIRNVAKPVQGFVKSEPAHGYDAVLLDPPRTGANEAVGYLLRTRVARIVYVSCGADTFARDAKNLVKGGYRLSEVRVLDMFPQTAHVELVATFERG